MTTNFWDTILRACDLGHRIPCARRHVLAEGFFDERHEDRTLRRPHVGTEHLPPFQYQQARAVLLDRQAGARSGRAAPERHEALWAVIGAERAGGVPPRYG